MSKRKQYTFLSVLSTIALHSATHAPFTAQEMHSKICALRPDLGERSSLFLMDNLEKLPQAKLTDKLLSTIQETASYFKNSQLESLLLNLQKIPEDMYGEFINICKILNLPESDHPFMLSTIVENFERLKDPSFIQEVKNISHEPEIYYDMINFLATNPTEGQKKTFSRVLNELFSQIENNKLYKRPLTCAFINYVEKYDIESYADKLVFTALKIFSTRSKLLINSDSQKIQIIQTLFSIDPQFHDSILNFMQKNPNSFIKSQYVPAPESFMLKSLISIHTPLPIPEKTPYQVFDTDAFFDLRHCASMEDLMATLQSIENRRKNEDEKIERQYQEVEKARKEQEDKLRDSIICDMIRTTAPFQDALGLKIRIGDLFPEERAGKLLTAIGKIREYFSEESEKFVILQLLNLSPDVCEKLVDICEKLGFDAKINPNILSAIIQAEKRFENPYFIKEIKDFSNAKGAYANIINFFLTNPTEKKRAMFRTYLNNFTANCQNSACENEIAGSLLNYNLEENGSKLLETLEKILSEKARAIRNEDGRALIASALLKINPSYYDHILDFMKSNPKAFLLRNAKITINDNFNYDGFSSLYKYESKEGFISVLQTLNFATTEALLTLKQFLNK